MSNRGSMNHLRLNVSDLAVSAPCYETILSHLGYHLAEQEEHLHGWARKGPGGNLQWIILSVKEPGATNTPYDRGSPGLQHIALNAANRSDVDALYRRLIDRRLAVEREPREYEYERGYYALFVTDPDGMVIEVVHTPDNTVDDYRPAGIHTW